MHWTGYAQAAWTVLGAIESEELGPAAPPAGLDFDSLARRYELPPSPPALPGLEAPQEGAAWTCPGSIPPP